MKCFWRLCALLVLIIHGCCQYPTNDLLKKDNIILLNVLKHKDLLPWPPKTIDVRMNNITVSLMRDESVIAPDFSFVNRHANTSKSNFKTDTCMTYTTVDTHINIVADVCSGEWTMNGLLVLGSTVYNIHPVKEVKRQTKDVPHRISLVTKLNDFGEDVTDLFAFDRHNRQRRSMMGVKSVKIETAVFVDRDLLRYMQTVFPDDTERHLLKFVLAMFNAVQLLYHDPSLGVRVDFVLKRLEILHTEPIGLHRSSNIDHYLASFCHWQENQNNGQSWDHALMLTGLDLYVISKSRRVSNQVVGLAPVAGMCIRQSSCTVNEGRHFESVFVVAHEIGHNLGMRHDGPSANNNCDASQHIMAPTLATGRSTWSSCSRDYLLDFLRSPQAHCLFESSGAQLDHTAGGSLPGERFDSDMQCMLRYGPGSVHKIDDESETDICRDLRCTKERFTWTSHPALEGTACKPGMWCRKGKCITKDSSMRLTASTIPIDGGWSSWGLISPCASPCFTQSEDTGSTGIMILARLCNNPRPENGGKSCLGVDRQYELCNALQCGNVPVSTVPEFAEGICRRAKDVDKTLTGIGRQRLTTDKEETCTVWCDTINGGAKSRGWIFPDGTACGTNVQTRHFCIAGKCEEFLCQQDNATFVSSPELCSTAGFRKPQTVIHTRWTPVGPCHSNCILNGRGLRILRRGPELNIQLCDNEKACGRKRSVFDHAGKICRRYSEKVDKLSGLGVQLAPSFEEPDRACHVACQDQQISNRFFLVTGEDGWFPFGTDCGRGLALASNNKAFCVSGKCLEFGDDDIPRLEGEFIFPNIKRRRRRSFDTEPSNFSVLTRVDNDAVRKVIEALHNLGGIPYRNPSLISDFTLDLNNPIHDDTWLTFLKSNSPFL